MDRLKRSFTFRSKKAPALIDKTSKPPQWNDDERKVRDGTCSFQVKYLGSIEVFESRGMPVCEEAMKQLLKYKSRVKNSKRAVLYVSGDALRVTEEISKGLIVDQVIEKVSFCAPDKNHHRGFAYICRDAATRRWLCHGFKAVKESGERLSHAVGCAFAVCLERKQQRDKDTVEVTFNENKTSFTRLGSFRQATITERLLDPQSVIIPEAVPSSANTAKAIDEQSSIPRPHASQSVLDRQSSLRIFPKLQDQQKNPFKRDYSVRVTDVASNHERKQLWQNDGSIKEESIDPKPPATDKPHNGTTHTSEISSNKREADVYSVISKPNPDKKPGLGNIFADDPFSAAPINPAAHIKQSNNNQVMSQSNFNSASVFQQSQRQPEVARPFVNPHLPNHKVNGNNSNNGTHIWPTNNQYRSFNVKSSATWSDDILRPVAKASEPPSKNLPLYANSSHNNPFDVSWVNRTMISTSTNSNNPFK